MSINKKKNSNNSQPAASLVSLDKLIDRYRYLVGIEDRVDAEDLQRAREECYQQDRECEEVLKRIPVPALYEGFIDVIRRLPTSIEDDEMEVRVNYLRRWRGTLEEYADLFFPGEKTAEYLAQRAHVITMCERISESAKVLRKRLTRSTGVKDPYAITDEYDVQDLLQAVIKGSISCSVTEDPIGKTAGVRSARADLALEELGIIIELKYARKSDDQKQFVVDLSLDCQLYAKWKPLESLIFLIYNSDALQDAEAMEREFSGAREVADKKFQVFVVLS